MSTPVIGFAQPAIDAVYEDATYDIRKLGTHLTTVDAAWDEVLILATFRNGLQGALAYFGEADRPIYVSEEDTSWFTDMVTAGRMRGWHEDMARDLQFEPPRPLMVERVHLNSPLEITLAAAGSTGVTIYALHLLSVVLRHPDSIGGWLPRLAAGWYRARHEAEQARLDYRRESQREKVFDTVLIDHTSKLTDIAANLPDLQASEVRVTGGTGGVPEEITDAQEFAALLEAAHDVQDRGDIESAGQNLQPYEQEGTGRTIAQHEGLERARTATDRRIRT
jgi:hypothetical protein